jgi:integrase
VYGPCLSIIKHIVYPYQALNAILFLYREVLNLEVSEVNAIRAKRSQYLPTVLTKAEVQAVIQQICGVQQLVVKLLYGGGLRLCEGLRLRVKDVDFAQHQILVQDSKGSKSRVTMLPTSVSEELHDHLIRVEVNTPRVHVAFGAETREMVQAFYKAALEVGGRDNGAPGLRTHYHPNYYGAFVLDPDGHNIEAVCHVPV